MIDTGAVPNVIIKISLHPHIPVTYGEPFYFSGIRSGRVETLGSVEINWLGHSVVYIVLHNFPIAQKGILESDFLRDAANIYLQEQCLQWKGMRLPLATRDIMVVPA